ncbi:MAG: SpoVA/SpoVAEb family sporulation membrane protein [Bacilli bacterium]|nr:SpoVA/SpoVAEb family sporulation membrane protein [Bacilli bacterium]
MNYQNIVKNITPKEKRLENAIAAFISGGLIGSMSEILVSSLGVDAMLIAWIVAASLLTGLGKFDTIVDYLKMGVIIPITGFAHSVSSASLEYKEEGFITGIGANFLKLAGSVILYGIVAASILALVRCLLWLV